MLSAICFKLDQSKILFSGNGLNKIGPLIAEIQCKQKNSYRRIDRGTDEWMDQQTDSKISPPNIIQGRGYENTCNGK